MCARKIDQHGCPTKNDAKHLARGSKRSADFGFGCKYGYDIPTVFASSVRLLGAMACVLDFDTHPIDMEQAFTTSYLEQEVLMRVRWAAWADAMDDELVCLQEGIWTVACALFIDLIRSASLTCALGY